jgi:hypothetical protein
VAKCVVSSAAAGPAGNWSSSSKTKVSTSSLNSEKKRNSLQRHHRYVPLVRRFSFIHPQGENAAIVRFNEFLIVQLEILIP